MSDNRNEGLVSKYRVERNDSKPIKEGCFVLEWSDPNARQGLLGYTRAVRDDGYLKLADEMEGKLSEYPDSAVQVRARAFKDAVVSAMKDKRALVVLGNAGSGKSELLKSVTGEWPAIIVDESDYLAKDIPDLYSTLAQLREAGAAVVISAQVISSVIQSFIDQVNAEVIRLSA